MGAGGPCQQPHQQPVPRGHPVSHCTPALLVCNWERSDFLPLAPCMCAQGFAPVSNMNDNPPCSTLFVGERACLSSGMSWGWGIAFKHGHREPISAEHAPCVAHPHPLGPAPSKHPRTLAPSVPAHPTIAAPILQGTCLTAWWSRSCTASLPSSPGSSS